MPEAQRAPFASKYEEERAEYQRAFEKYVASGKAAAWKRDPAKPTRPPTAFLLFCSDFRAANPELKVVEASKQAGAKWKAMGEREKEPYAKRVAGDWARTARRWMSTRPRAWCTRGRPRSACTKKM